MQGRVQDNSNNNVYVVGEMMTPRIAKVRRRMEVGTRDPWMSQDSLEDYTFLGLKSCLSRQYA